MSQAAAYLKTTPLNAMHRSSGAKMVDFGGWDMPVQYSGILAEHEAVRRRVGLFDVSHMGEIELRGPDALTLIEAVTCNAASKLSNGQAQYSGLLYDHGGFVDDILVHRVDDDHYFLCVNSSNQEKDYDYISTANRYSTKVEFASDRYAQVAVQGPRAVETVQKIASIPLGDIRYYWFRDAEAAGIPARLARTGYTGEDGFEIYVASEEAEKLWAALLDAGDEFGILPCGLGARNTLRLESKMALYGHEIDASITPYEGDLGWIVKLDKGDFAGSKKLREQKEQGVQRKIAGFEMLGRGIGRDGYEVHVDGKPAGWITSGGPSPTLGKNIGLAMLPVAATVPGTRIQVIIRNQPVDAVVVPTPFYKRAKS